MVSTVPVISSISGNGHLPFQNRTASSLQPDDGAEATSQAEEYAPLASASDSSDEESDIGGGYVYVGSHEECELPLPEAEQRALMPNSNPDAQFQIVNNDTELRGSSHSQDGGDFVPRDSVATEEEDITATSSSVESDPHQPKSSEIAIDDERRAAILGAMKNIQLVYMPPWAISLSQQDWDRTVADISSQAGHER